MHTTALKPHVMKPVVMSFGGSWIVFVAFEHDGDVAFDFWKAGSYIMKSRVVYFETLCKHKFRLCYNTFETDK